MKKLYFLFFTFLITALSFGQIVINEIDADTPGADTEEFIELKWTPNTSLDGYVVVFFNGGDDLSNGAYDLDGYTTDANGFFILANSTTSGYNASTDVLLTGIQNGPEAIAVYFDDAANWPNDIAISSANLIDVVIYGTNDSDDTGLITGFGGGLTQYDESANGNSDTESLQRSDDGTTYDTKAPTFRAENNPTTLSIGNISVNQFALYPNPTSLGYVNISSRNSDTIIQASVFDVLGKQVINSRVINNRLDVSNLNAGVYIMRLAQNNAAVTKKLVIQ